LKRSIDFAILGVPRSGTSALTRAVNLHEEIFCGMEFLRSSDNHRTINYPADFRALEHLTVNQRSILDRLIRDKANPKLLGNKQPRYYLALQRLTASVPGLKLIWLYRSPRQYAQSWQKRAENDQDVLWHRGQTAVFGILEGLICAKVMANSGESVLVVPYGALFLTNPDSLADIFTFLDVSASPRAVNNFQDRMFDRALIKQKRRDISKQQGDLLESMNYREMDSVLDRPSVFMLHDVVDDLLAYIDSVESQAREKFFEIASSFSVAEEHYFEGWKKNHRVREFLRPRKFWNHFLTAR
jgi:hypothetical protein